MKNKHLKPRCPAKVGRYRGGWPLRFAALCLGLSMLSCITTEDIFGLDKTKLVMKVSGSMTLNMFKSGPLTIDLSESSGDCWRDSWTENKHSDLYPAHHILTLYCLNGSFSLVMRIPLEQSLAIKRGGITTIEDFIPTNQEIIYCRYVEGTLFGLTEVISDHQSGTDFPIEFKNYPVPEDSLTTKNCINSNMHVLIPQQEQEIPYDPKTSPMTENQRKRSKDQPQPSMEQEE